MRKIFTLALALLLLAGWRNGFLPHPSFIDVSSLAVGTVTANSLSPTCVANPADTVAANTTWTTASTKYLTAPTNAQYVVNTKSGCDSRDVEVTTWTHHGVVYLRLDSNGNALYFSHNGDAINGSLEIGIATGVGQGSFMQGNYYALYQNSDLVDSGWGYTLSNTDGQAFTFGVQGFTIYVKYNGTQVVSFQDYRQMSVGAVAMQSLGAGFRNITITPLANQFLYSAYSANQLDLRDFGLRSIQTTGTVAATTTASATGSISGNTLTVSGVTGTIAVGQKVTGGGGSGVLPDTIITAGSGTTWTVSNPQTVSSGSMSFGSTTLTVASASGLLVNDFIIVEIGNEAGAGLLGTTGVGGVWPALSYADSMAMNADTGQAQYTFAWTQNDGRVYSWSGINPAYSSGTTYNSGAHVTDAGINYISNVDNNLNHTPASSPTQWGSLGPVNTWSTSFQCPSCSSTAYYTQHAVPMSLVARITGISGNTLTLDTPAAVTATNANVYLDNELILNNLTQPARGLLPAVTPSNLTLIFPAGSFAFGGHTEVGIHSGWTIQGQGQGSTTLFSPKGVFGAGILADRSSNNFTAQNFTLSGNLALNNDVNNASRSYGLNWPTVIVPAPASLISSEYDSAGKILTTFSNGPTVTQTSNATYYFTSGITMHGDNSVAQNITVNDVFTDAVQCQDASNCWAYNITVNVNSVRQTYTQWQFEWAGTTGGGCQNCNITSLNIVQGYENFGSGNPGAQFINPTSVNAAFSLNAAGQDWLISGANVTFNIGSQTLAGAWTPGNGMVTVNNNTGVAQGAGSVVNSSFTQTGYLNGYVNNSVTYNNNVEIGINVTAGTPGFTANNITYTAPNYTATGNPRTQGPVGINSGADNTSVSGFTAHGTTASPGTSSGSNITLFGPTGSTLSVINSTFDSCFATAGATLSGNSGPCP